MKSMLDLDDSAFLKFPPRRGSVVETMHPVHAAMGLWPFRVVKGVSNPVRPPYCRVFDFHCIAHMYEGKGYLWMPGKGVVPVAPGDCVLVAPDVLHAYGGDGEPFVEDAVCFKGPVPDCLFSNGIIRCGVFPLGMERRLLPLIELAKDPAPASQAKAALALESLLAELCSRDGSGSSASGDSLIAKLLDALRLSPGKWWTVKEMASFCGLSAAQFRRRFDKAVGMAPKRYVESFKMRCAAEDLARGDVSVSAVARKFSYFDPYHFSRRFKAVIGMPPRKLLKRPFGD